MPKPCARKWMINDLSEVTFNFLSVYNYYIYRVISSMPPRARCTSGHLISLWRRCTSSQTCAARTWVQFHSHDELCQYITADVMNKRREIFITRRFSSALLQTERQIDHRFQAAVFAFEANLLHGIISPTVQTKRTSVFALLRAFQHINMLLFSSAS